MPSRYAVDMCHIKLRCGTGGQSRQSRNPMIHASLSLPRRSELSSFSRRVSSWEKGLLVSSSYYSSSSRRVSAGRHRLLAGAPIRLERGGQRQLVVCSHLKSVRTFTRDRQRVIPQCQLACIHREDQRSPGKWFCPESPCLGYLVFH